MCNMRQYDQIHKECLYSSLYTEYMHNHYNQLKNGISITCTWDHGSVAVVRCWDPLLIRRMHWGSHASGQPGASPTFHGKMREAIIVMQKDQAAWPLRMSQNFAKESELALQIHVHTHVLDYIYIYINLYVIICKYIYMYTSMIIYIYPLHTHTYTYTMYLYE